MILTGGTPLPLTYIGGPPSPVLRKASQYKSADQERVYLPWSGGDHGSSHQAWVDDSGFFCLFLLSGLGHQILHLSFQLTKLFNCMSAYSYKHRNFKPYRLLLAAPGFGRACRNHWDRVARTFLQWHLVGGDRSTHRASLRSILCCQCVQNSWEVLLQLRWKRKLRP